MKGNNMCNKEISLIKDCKQIGKDVATLCSDTCTVVKQSTEKQYNIVKDFVNYIKNYEYKGEQQ